MNILSGTFQGGRGYPISPQEFGVGVLLAKPYSYLAESPDFRNSSPPPEVFKKHMFETPICGVIAAYGAQGGLIGAHGSSSTGRRGDWNKTYQSKTGRYAGGTAGGGWVFMPPEVGLDSLRFSLKPPGVTRSTVYFVAAPNAYFAAGLPSLPGGGVATGYSWGVDEDTGDLVFRSHSSLAAAAETARFKAASMVFNPSNANLDFGANGDTTNSILAVDASNDEAFSLGKTSYRAVTKAAITANQDDYDLGVGTFFRLSTDGVADYTITGFAGGTDGRHITLANVDSTGKKFILGNQNAGSSAANRIITGTGGNTDLNPDDLAEFIYDSMTSRWRQKV